MESEDIDSIVGIIEQSLLDEGLVNSISHELDGRLLKLEVSGCLHLAVEQRLVDKGIEPFTCIPANLVVLAIEETLDRPVELAEIKIVDGMCHLLLVIFESRPTFD